MKHLSATIFRTLREITQPHLSAEKLAEKLDLSTSCVQAVERGTSKPSQKTILKYGSYYKIPESQFLQLFLDAINGEKSEKELISETQRLYNMYN